MRNRIQQQGGIAASNRKSIWLSEAKKENFA